MAKRGGRSFTVYRRLKSLLCLIIPDIKMPLYASADINFITKMQKWKIAITILPMITRKHNLANFGCGGDMLKNL